MIRASLILSIAVLAGCATAPGADDSEMCAQIERFARAVQDGQPRSVTLGRGGIWMVDHYKFCKREDDAASVRFCEWLMEHTSTEFMEANINRALSCLQGQRIQGYVGNTGIESWSGKIMFYAPRLDVPDVKIELDYEMHGFSDAEDYLKISVIPD